MLADLSDALPQMLMVLEVTSAYPDFTLTSDTARESEYEQLDFDLFHRFRWGG